MTARQELTRFDVMTDPLIRQVMEADRVAAADLAMLMAEVAARLAPRAAHGAVETRQDIEACRPDRNGWKYSRNQQAT